MFDGSVLGKAGKGDREAINSSAIVLILHDSWFRCFILFADERQGNTQASTVRDALMYKYLTVLSIQDPCIS